MLRETDLKRTSPAGLLPRRYGPGCAARLGAQNGALLLVLAATLPTAWTTHSIDEWWWSAAVCVLFAVMYRCFGIPARYLLAWPCRVLFAAGLVAIVASAVVHASMLHGPLSVGDAGPLALAAAVLALRVADQRRRLTRMTASLRWPLPDLRWTVAEGTGTVLHHHWPAVAQRGALDLVCSVRGGRSTAAVRPRRCEAFPAYGALVVAPCSGVVRTARDGCPDRPQKHAPAPGNHVVIASEDGDEVLLAHLKLSSVAVRKGESVAEGETVGRVGNSGDSSEPHLHIHATRDGCPLRLRFTGVRGSLRRNAVIAPRI